MKNGRISGIIADSHENTGAVRSAANATIRNFARSYAKITGLISGEFDSMGACIAYINSVIFRFYEGAAPDLEDSFGAVITNELKKYRWSLTQEGNERNVVTPQILGYFFEQLINKKEMGAYYTPVDTTEYMCRIAVVSGICNSTAAGGELLEAMLKRLRSEPGVYLRGTSPDTVSGIRDYEELIRINADILGLFIDALNREGADIREEIFRTVREMTIIDPTVGTGAFIITAANILIEIFDKAGFGEYGLSRNEYIRHIFSRNLFGVDIMDDAISFLKFRIKLFLYENGISDDQLCRSLDNFKCGNAVYSGDGEEDSDRYGIPFHWEREYPEIFAKGGFSCVIGNPPYIEWSRNKDRQYHIEKLRSAKCGNVYAFVFEKAFDIIAPTGFISLIVPISIISTKRMSTLVEIIREKSSYAFFSAFGDRPAALFSGVHQKTAIAFCNAAPGKNRCRTYTSGYYHWTASERGALFDRISYYRSPTNEGSGIVCKIGSPEQESILNKIRSKTAELTGLFSETETEFPMYLNMRATFWCKCFVKPQSSKEYKCFYAQSRECQDFLYCLFNSSLFFMVWETVSDCWHITGDIFRLFTAELCGFGAENSARVRSLAAGLSEDLEKNKRYIGSKQTEYEYLHKRSKKLIDGIDRLFAEYYGFDEEELSFILGYALPYRMSDEYDNYIKEVRE